MKSRQARPPGQADREFRATQEIRKCQKRGESYQTRRRTTLRAGLRKGPPNVTICARLSSLGNRKSHSRKSSNYAQRIKTRGHRTGVWRQVTVWIADAIAAEMSGYTAMNEVSTMRVLEERQHGGCALECRLRPPPRSAVPRVRVQRPSPLRCSSCWMRQASLQSGDLLRVQMPGARRRTRRRVPSGRGPGRGGSRPVGWRPRRGRPRSPPAERRSANHWMT